MQTNGFRENRKETHECDCSGLTTEELFFWGYIKIVLICQHSISKDRLDVLDPFTPVETGTNLPALKGWRAW